MTLIVLKPIMLMFLNEVNLKKLNMNLMLITNTPKYASYAEACGVDIIFIDLEIIGKVERQGHLNSVISDHSIKDVKEISNVLTSAKLLVRINPYGKYTAKEIDDAIRFGADIIMLPMFKTADEIKSVHELIDGRADFIPLLETKAAVENIDEILDLNVLNKIHIGLNDLHLDYGLKHMFELLNNGTVTYLVEKLNKYEIEYGIGGVAAMDSGDISGDLVLAKYMSLKSQRVILSRAFHSNYKADLALEINKLRLCLAIEDISINVNGFDEKVVLVSK